MILELDCGNSFIKWRVFQPELAISVSNGVAASLVELIADVSLCATRLTRARLVSVRGDEETDTLCQDLGRFLNIPVSRAVPARELGGVINGYEEYDRLGLDRWLAIVGAYSINHQAALVLDLGTAVTADLVGADGVHLGGYIAPGMPLLRHQLQAHTRRVRYELSEAALAVKGQGPGRSTVEAVERGCLLMLRGFVEAQIRHARICLGDNAAMFVTGGDAVLVADMPNLSHAPDLIFRGLAIACP
ncbi:type III pantothenate kinase [Stutzerimonas stutzeri]|uniref:type III pantothenate kinase n=1 Tax=Stutzerimonas sp. S1 TaxID=3030652 RepID=UPI0022251FB8|nr:type III pantothenate kinase [Stutzerimonas sp. S1]MCW3150886.1 type III pantothenate kinase [Stutzerimonas sp. S1]